MEPNVTKGSGASGEDVLANQELCHNSNRSSLKLMVYGANGKSKSSQAFIVLHTCMYFNVLIF